MLNFTFKARTAAGNMISDLITADCRETVVATLKRKGYYVLEIRRENQLLAIINRNSTLGKHISIKERAIFTHQLATLLKAGMRLTIALNTLAKQTESKYLATVIKQMHTDIEQSSSLSEAMEKHPKVFPKVYTAIVEASEQSGSLAETLTTLSQQLKSQASVTATIRAAMVYPAFLLVVSALVVAVLTTFVIPKFIALFISANQKLPLPTKILVGSINFLKEFWWIAIFAVIGLICFMLTVIRNRQIRFAVDSAMLKLPVIGTVNRKLQLARFARTLGSLLNGGVKIISAVNTTKGITGNTAFAKEIENIEKGILNGSTLAGAIAQQRHFSHIAANMVAVGEDTGTLPEMLLELAQMYDQECESAMNSLTSLLGPVIIVFLGLIIGFVVMAILMPIFETSAIIG